MTRRDTATCGNCQRVYRGEADFLSGTSRWRMCSSANLWFNCSCGSTLLIVKGKYDWYHPTKFLSSGAASLFNRLAGMDALPHMPAGLLELQQVLSETDSPTATVAEAVKRVPFLAADLLRLANAAASARGGRITTIEHAVVFVGRSALSDLAIAARLSEVSRTALRGRSYSYSRFWEETLLGGTLAERLVQRLKLPLSPDEVYLAGCFANIGKLVAALRDPELTEKIAAVVYDGTASTTWSGVERAFHAPSHALLGEIGASIWGMPKFVVETAQHHHDEPLPVRAQHEPPSVQAVASLACQLAHVVRGEPGMADKSVLHGRGAALGLEPRDLALLAGEWADVAREISRAVAASESGEQTGAA